MATKLASAFVEITTKLGGLRHGIEQARSMVTRGIRGIGAAFAGIGVAAAAGTAFTGIAISAAANAQEVQSKFDAVFKDLAGETEEFARLFATNIGRSTSETVRQLAEFQDTFVPLGFARKEAAGLSKQMIALTADIASFNNEADPDVQQALTSALVGNHDAVRRFGIIITEATLNQQLMNMGIDKGTKAATEQEKVMARLAIIMNSTTDATGDAIKTSGSFTNRLKALKGAVQDLLVEFGTPFLEPLAKIMEMATIAVRSMMDDFQRFGEFLSGAFSLVVQDWKLTTSNMEMTLNNSLTVMVGSFESLFGFAFGRIAASWTFTLIGMRDQFVDLLADLGKLAFNFATTGFAGSAGALGSTFGNALGGLQAPKGFREGFAGLPLQSLIEDQTDSQDSLNDSMQKLKDTLQAQREAFLKDLQQRKRDAAGEDGPADEGNMGNAVGNAITKGFQRPHGLFAFDELQRTIQQSFLDQADPQRDMVRLLNQDKTNQNQQLAQLKGINQKLDNVLVQPTTATAFT